MTDKEDNYEDIDNQSNEESDEIILKSGNLPEDEENLRRTSSSLNNYSILPPIKSAINENDSQQQDFLKHLQEKYQQENGSTSEMNANAKLDDAYLKMKRLDKALEEAFEKEKQVKFETLSLMKKLRHEMQSMTITVNSDSNELSHTQTNFKRFLALDDEILKLDGCSIDDDNSNPTESIFKTQISDPFAESNSSLSKNAKDSSTNQTRTSSLNKKKKSSISSTTTTTTNTKDTLKKTKMPEKDFIKRNIELAKELGGTYALTDDEKQRLNEILNEDEQDNALVVSNQQINGFLPSFDDSQRLKQIDDLLEKEYYNPFLNHQLRRNYDNDIDYSHIQQINNEENEQMDNPFGEKILKETRLQREHMQRLKIIDEQLERLHRPVTTDEKIEAILSDEQLNELLGQCAVDEMKQRFSLLNRDKQNQDEIDFNDLSNYALTHYVDHNQGPMITDEIIQLLINEAQQEGIAMRTFEDDDDDDDSDSFEQKQIDSLSLAPAIDRPLSSTSTMTQGDM